MPKKKPKTVSKTKPARKAKPATRRTSARSDRCQPLRDQLERVEQEIAEIEEALAEPDIPVHLKERLRRLLPRLKGLRMRLLQALRECEAIPDPRR